MPGIYEKAKHPHIYTVYQAAADQQLDFLSHKQHPEDFFLSFLQCCIRQHVCSIRLMELVSLELPDSFELFGAKSRLPERNR